MSRRTSPALAALAILFFVLFVLAWLGGTVACVAYATCVRDGGGALVLAMLVFCGGYGFACEARQAL